MLWHLMCQIITVLFIHVSSYLITTSITPPKSNLTHTTSLCLFDFELFQFSSLIVDTPKGSSSSSFLAPAAAAAPIIALTPAPLPTTVTFPQFSPLTNPGPTPAPVTAPIPIPPPTPLQLNAPPATAPAPPAEPWAKGVGYGYGTKNVSTAPLFVFLFICPALFLFHPILLLPFISLIACQKNEKCCYLIALIAVKCYYIYTSRLLLFIHRPIHPSFPSFVTLSGWLAIYVYICEFLFLNVYLFIYLSILICLALSTSTAPIT